MGRPIGIKIPTVNAKVTDRFDPNLMRENDMKNKQKIKQNAENQRCIKECQINVGDSVLVKQRKENKFSQPFNPTPMVVVEKNNSMITAKSDNKTVTRNSSHFKKANVAERKGREINERASHSSDE